MNGCFTASGWTPEGRRARGRPKTTWRRREKQSGAEELEFGEGGGGGGGGLSGQCDGLMRLLAQRAMIVIKKSRGSFGE